MKNKGCELELKLDGESIDLCSEKVGEYLKELKTARKEMMRIRLSVEEILLSWQEHFGDECRFVFKIYTFLRQPTVELRLFGSPFNPCSEEENEMGSYSRKMLSNLQATPLYSYKDGVNIISFKLQKKQRSPLFFLLFALAASAIVGLLGHYLPDTFRTDVVEKVLAPLCTTYVNVLNLAGIPLIFLCVALGIRGIGDPGTFGKIGKKMILHFLAVLLFATAFAALIGYPFFSFEGGTGGFSIQLGNFYEMLLGFLPTGLFEPFINCNAMQLLILGVAFGIALLILHPRAAAFGDMLEGINDILLLISKWFTRAIPFFVFVTIVKALWSEGLDDILTAWKSWVLTVGIQLLMVGLMMVQICIKNKIKLSVLVKKTLSTFLIALGTNSCCATIPEIYAGLDNMGVSGRISGFGVPIGTSVFKPACAVRFVLLSFFMAELYSVEVTAGWLVTAVVMSAILSIAVPAIPGGVLMFCPMLFAQLGIPAEAVGGMLATDIFFDVFCTAFCQVSAELALVQQAGIMNMLDGKKLRTVK